MIVNFADGMSYTCDKFKIVFGTNNLITQIESSGNTRKIEVKPIHIWHGSLPPDYPSSQLFLKCFVVANGETCFIPIEEIESTEQLSATPTS